MTTGGYRKTLIANGRNNRKRIKNGKEIIMVNLQTVLNIAFMVVIIIMGAIIVMQYEKTCPVVEQPPIVECPVTEPIVKTVYTENKTCMYIEQQLFENVNLTKAIERIPSEPINYPTSNFGNPDVTIPKSYPKSYPPPELKP
jgi:hypothetical protein